MLKKVKYHGSAQKSLGCATMTGMLDQYCRVKSGLHNNGGGEQESLVSYSFRNLCFKMRVGDGQLWQGILPNITGGYNGFFAGTDPATSTWVTEFADNAADI